jgi:hypothetical protein
VGLYQSDAKPYLLFHKLGEPRAKYSKYPEPPAQLDASGHPFASVNGCKQTPADAPYSYSYSDSDSYSDSTCESGPTPDSPAGKLSGGGKRAKAKPAKAGAKSREPDPLFDAIAAVTGADVRASAPHVAKVRHALARADPPYTPDEVRRFGSPDFLARHLTWAKDRGRPTLGEVEKYIGLVRSAREPPAARSAAECKDF